MTMRLRTADPADLDAVVDLIHALNVYEAGIVRDRLTHRDAARDSYHRLQERVAAGDGRIVLAEREGRVVGCLGFIVAQDEPFVREDLRRYGLVTDLVVAEEERGRGIGRALLAEAERLTREKGLRRLFIGVLDGNADARRAYAASGFSDYVRTMVKDLD